MLAPVGLAVVPAGQKYPGGHAVVDTASVPRAATEDTLHAGITVMVGAEPSVKEETAQIFVHAASKPILKVPAAGAQAKAPLAAREVCSVRGSTGSAN